jgi:hypothetical protein
MAVPSFNFECPVCHRRIGVNQHVLGRRMRCAHCFEFVELRPASAEPPLPIRLESTWAAALDWADLSTPHRTPE